jgi:hypothetical protein
MYDHPLYRAAVGKDGSSNPQLMPRVAAQTDEDPVIDSYKAYAEFLKHRQQQLYWSELVREDEESRPKFKPNWWTACRACIAIKLQHLIVDEIGTRSKAKIFPGRYYLACSYPLPCKPLP